ncbi:MAG TPA: peptidylprolyl isomerase [Anaerolineae bacterium]|nr:peptidylprolyl isomerase [Anaerolineae bacterium]
MTKAERERARLLTIIVGAVVGLALLVLVVGLLYQSVIIPSTAVATVNGQRIATRDLWKLTRFDQFQRINQLQNLLQFQEQIDPGGQQGFFTSQIQQLQSDLISPEGSTNRVLEQMIEERLVRQLADKNNIVVSDAEVQADLESLVAAQIGMVTAPEATATAEALAVATPTPSPTPSPTPTSTLGITLPTLPPTPEPTPTVQVQTEADFNTGLEQLLANVSQGANVSQDDARQLYIDLISSNILREKLTEQLGDQMPTSGEQVRARHILISVAADASEADKQLALAEAISITQRLRAGEDFAELALQFSDDTGSGQQGGDLGFFARGQMVTEFDDAAFSLPIGEISDPVLSQFGYHIIEVLEQQPGSPNFTAWLQEQKSLAEIVRSLTSARLPSLPAVPPQLFVNPTSSAPLVTTPAAP